MGIENMRTGIPADHGGIGLKEQTSILGCMRSVGATRFGERASSLDSANEMSKVAPSQFGLSVALIRFY
jgi:hypothetical protein